MFNKLKNAANIFQFFLKATKKNQIISSGTDEVRAKREPSLCNESVKRHFWLNWTKNCMSGRDDEVRAKREPSSPLTGLHSRYFSPSTVKHQNIMICLLPYKASLA